MKGSYLFLLIYVIFHSEEQWIEHRVCISHTHDSSNNLMFAHHSFSRFQFFVFRFLVIFIKNHIIVLYC